MVRTMPTILLVNALYESMFKYLKLQSMIIITNSYLQHSNREQVWTSDKY